MEFLGGCLAPLHATGAAPARHPVLQVKAPCACNGRCFGKFAKMKVGHGGDNQWYPGGEESVRHRFICCARIWCQVAFCLSKAEHVCLAITESGTSLKVGSLLGLA